MEPPSYDGDEISMNSTTFTTKDLLDMRWKEFHELLQEALKKGRLSHDPSNIQIEAYQEEEDDDGKEVTYTWGEKFVRTEPAITTTYREIKKGEK